MAHSTKIQGYREYYRTMRAKKSLGQNFLKSEMVLKKILEAGEIKSDDVILEIGPGKGVLTERLLEKSGQVIAIEKDNDLFNLLKIKFEKEIENKKLLLICEDILDFKPPITNYKIIANIPYNITGAILKKFLTEKHQPERMILMVQHEVASRIVGRGSSPSTPLKVKESIFSISVKAYGEPKMIMKVPARYFSPAPKVDSAIIAIKNISRQTFEENKINEEKFWKIVKAGFAHKRKKLSSNLKSLKNYEKYVNKTLLDNLENQRAEDLPLLSWIALAK